MTVICVGSFCPIRRHFCHLRLHRHCTVGQPCLDDIFCTKNSHNLLRCGIGCDVDVIAWLTSQRIPDTSANKPGFPAVFFQFPQHLLLFCVTFHESSPFPESIVTQIPASSYTTANDKEVVYELSWYIKHGIRRLLQCQHALFVQR